MGFIARLLGFSPTVSHRALLLFLGGTVGNNPWRKPFIGDLTKGGVPLKSIFDPALPPGAWNDEAQKKEEESKVGASHMLYFLADPGETGDTLPSDKVIEMVAGLARKPTASVHFSTAGLSDKSHARKTMRNAAKILKEKFPHASLTVSDEPPTGGEDFVIASAGPGATLSTYSMVEAYLGLLFDPARTVVVFDTAGMTEGSALVMREVEQKMRADFPRGTILGNKGDALKHLTKEMNIRK